MVISAAPEESSSALLEGIAIATNKLLTIADDDDSVQQALITLGKTTQVDRIYIFENHPHPDTGNVAMSQRWEWVAPNVTPEIDNPELQNLEYQSFFPRWYRLLKSGEVVSGWVEDFPDSEREILDPQDIQSILIVPIMIRSQFWGFIGFDDCHSKRFWTTAERTALLALGGSIGGSVVQRRSEIQLRELNETLEQRVRDRTQELQQEKEKAEHRSRILESTLQELKQTQCHLIQTEKMSALGQLVASVAHEINNPVNFVRGNIRYTESYFNDLNHLIHLYEEEHPNPSPEIRTERDRIDLDFLREDLLEIFGSMKMGVDRIAEIVKSLKTFSRSDRSHLQEIDLHGQINDTLTILQTRLRKGSNIQIIKRYDQNLPLVQCYAGQLSQVFMNILSNAIDALRGDSQGINSNRLSKTFCQDNVWRGESNCGESNCSESNCSKSDHSGSSHGDNYRRKICICTRLYDDSAVITVADNGPGMDEITREKLFEPFFTTKSVEKGTGLGMAIAHRVVTERHGGTISCHSAPGQGTVFTVTLPLKPTPLQPTAQRAIVNSAQVAWGRVL